MLAIADLTGSGGAERQFSGLFNYLSTQSPGRVTFITSRASLESLSAAARLRNTSGVVALPLGDRPARSRLGVLWATAALAWATLGRGFDVVHICLPTPSYVPYAALMTRLPKGWRPKITLTVLDCTLAHHLRSGGATDSYEQQVLDAHRLYFRWTRLDGIYTWYRAFVEAAQSLRLLPGRAVLMAAAYCFTDTARFAPAAKTRAVVYAGRLSAQKRPLLFVDAIASLLRRHANAAAGWTFEMYGGGILEPQVRARLAELGLADLIPLTKAPDLSPVFARSRLFVSTQAYENFTSNAMLEAMAAGNAVVAEGTGQTDEFVKHGQNGYVVAEPASADAFADAIAEYMTRPESHAPMGAASRKLATEIHTIEHFADDIAAFWRRVVEREAV